MNDLPRRMAEVAREALNAPAGSPNPYADAAPGSDEQLLKRVWTQAYAKSRGFTKKLDDIEDPDNDLD
ncbi:MAG: hypothetical protein LLG14_12660 [Nocardiaceae bacterium]|nr:hypothetical protein [Nocardiaceae bacterium]